MAGSLIIRKRQDGSTTIESSLPDDHVFPARFIDREIATDLVEVRVTIKTSDGDVEYRLDRFEQIEGDEGPQSNYAAWHCSRVEQ